MATSNAATPDQYVAEIEDPARRDLVTKLREFIGERLPDGYVEQMGFGMPGWVVPMEQTGPTYNGQPLGVVGIAWDALEFAVRAVSPDDIVAAHESVHGKG